MSLGWRSAPVSGHLQAGGQSSKSDHSSPNEAVRTDRAFIQICCKASGWDPRLGMGWIARGEATNPRPEIKSNGKENEQGAKEPKENPARKKAQK